MSKPRLAALVLFVAVMGAAAVVKLTRETMPAPNVILISIDTLRADHLGCYGYKHNTSPIIDALAREGVRFRSAYSQTSWTLPSHMTIMTSQYPHVHGVETENRCTALADQLK